MLKKSIICMIVLSLLVTTLSSYAEEVNTTYDSQGFIYEIVGEGEDAYAKIVSYDPDIVSGEKLVIPTTLGGYEVKEFSDYIFQGTSFKYCDLSLFPNLSAGMFCDSQIEEVNLSKETKKIPDIIFANSQLTKIELPESTEVICQRAFYNTKLKEIMIPSMVKNIEYNAFEECIFVKKIVIAEGLEKLPDRENAYCGAAFETPNLEKLYLPKSMVYISPNEFKESNNQRFVGYTYSEKYPTMTIYAPEGSYAEEYAAEHELNFVTAESENSIFEDEKVNFESKYDISQFMDSSIYKIYDVFDTDYGAVVYYSMGGFMGAPGPGLSLVRENGDVVNLSIGVSKEDLYRRPEHNDIKLSEDGKYVTFNVSFGERAEGTEGVLGGNLVVYHDAGTYYYKSSLEDGTCIETKFEPIDTISEEIISAWAKTEVENAIEMGFVPLSFRDNYKRNITRGEFAKMAMFFLSIQYGYPGVPAVQLWSPVETYDNSFFPREFMNAYCYSRTDRNGNSFADINVGEAYVYNNNREILLDVTPFLDVNENMDLRFIERAYHLGIVNGISETEFNPDGEITRQEAAAMLMRVYKNYAEMKKIRGEAQFLDDKDIAEWAKEDVYSINSLGIMQGVGENIFDPLNGYTVEQAIITFWRLYDSAPVSRKNKNIEPLLEYEYELENYFNRAAATSYFHEQSRKEYENFIVVCGYWSRRHTTALDYSLYVFDKNGGVPYVSSLTEDMKWEVSSDEKVITCYYSVGDTFRLYNKLNGTEKVYGIGLYKTDYSVEQGKILNFERVK